MKVSFDQRVKKFLNSLSRTDKAKVGNLIDLFVDRGFSLSEIHLKKISRGIWELRPGKTRLLLGIVENEAIIVNIFIKKTTKTPLREIKLAEGRLTDYQ